MNDELDCCAIQTEVMNTIIRDQPSFDLVLEQIIDLYKEIVTDELANQLRAVEYHLTIRDLREWLQDLIKLTPPPKHMKAIYFGMFEYAPQEGSPVEYTQFYIDGSPVFDKDDEDWACECDWTYDSSLLYPVCSTFIEYAKLCNELENQLTYTLSQALTACIAIDLAQVLAQRLKFKKHKELPLAIGHDSGDIHILGSVTKSGFKPVASCE